MADCSTEGCSKKARKRGMCPACYYAATHTIVPCSVEGCSARSKANGMCNKHNSADWRAKGNKGKRPAEYYSPEATRDRNLRNLYQFSLAEFNAMAEAQGGLCAICRRPPNHMGVSSGKGRNCKVLHVDHDHNVKPVKVRGLLCIKCNVMIGKAEDSTAILQNGIDYLRSRGYP